MGQRYIESYGPKAYGIFINEDFPKDTMEKCKAKVLREEGKFAKVVYDRLIVRDRRSRQKMQNTVTLVFEISHFNKVNF